MKILFKTFGVLEKLIPSKEFLVPEERLTLRQFFEFLVHHYGPEVTAHLFPEGTFGSHYAILVNGVNIRLLKGMETSLKGGDQVSIFTLVAGG